MKPKKQILCSVQEIKPGMGKRIVLHDEEIVLFLVENEVCAIVNMCPHQKFQKLHLGMFENGIVTCPMHGWAYDVRTGTSTNASGRVKTVATEIHDGYVFLSDENSI